MALSTRFALVRQEKIAKNPEKITAIPQNPKTAPPKPGTAPFHHMCIL
jgi:hypothetical protein